MYIDLNQLKTIAANLYGSDQNPSYTVDDFLTYYPQFKNVPQTIIEYYTKLANVCLSYTLYQEQWTQVMGLYIAHFLTIYLKTMEGVSEDDPLAKQVIKSSLSFGLTASKSVGSLSLSYDYGSINDDLNGWAAWKMTIFGQLFASIARLIGKGGSYIW